MATPVREIEVYGLGEILSYPVSTIWRYNIGHAGFGDRDLKPAWLSVHRSLKRQKGRGLAFVEPTTKGSRRTIKLSDRFVSVLREHRRKQVEERLAFQGDWQMPELVFANESGVPLEPGFQSRRFKKLLERGGFPGIRIHDRRHTAATLLLQADVHVKLVSEMLGHAAITLTRDTYSHVIPTIHRQAANVMDELFG